MSIYNDFKNVGDSSDMDEDEAKNLIMKKDLVDLNLGDKIFIKEGELQGSHGVIKNFDDNRNQVVFKPTNIEGWDDNLHVGITMVVKYFEVGDCVKVIDGHYSGETAIVTKVNEDDISMPSIRLEDSKRELQLNTRVLQIMNEKDKDDIKIVKMRANQTRKNAAASLRLEAQRNSQILFKVGDLIMYDGHKTQGFIIEA